MTNTSKARGTAFETAVTRYLNEHGYPHAERRALAGKHDKGDIAGIPGVVIECKNHNSYAGQLAGWVDQAEQEAVNAAADFGVVVHKRRGKGVGQAYVTLSLDVFVTLLRAQGS